MNNSFTGINISGTASPRNDNKQAVSEQAGVSCSLLIVTSVQSAAGQPESSGV